MQPGTHTIGLAVTGDTTVLELFFSNVYREENITTMILPILRKIWIDGYLFYYFIEKEIKWDTNHQLECNALCRSAECESLSYYVCRLNHRTQQTFELSNEHASFFDWRVKKLFGVERTVQFKDWSCQAFKRWMETHFDKTALADMCHHGVHTGWQGLTYYSNTVALYEQYQDDIWKLLQEDCDNQGYKSILELIASFRQSDVETDVQFKNLLVWYAAEKIAFELTQSNCCNEDEKSEILKNTDEE